MDRFDLMGIIKLIEEEPSIIPKTDFSSEAARFLYEKYRNRIIIDFPTIINDNYIIRSNGYVGYIPINDKFSLQILPKVPIQNLFRMLEYAYHLKSFEFLQGQISVSSIKDVYENLASILAKRIIDRNRKGLYSSYILRNETLPTIRGRVDLLPSIISLSRGSTYLKCVYDEQTTDISDNQILAWTLYQLRRFEFTRIDVRRSVRLAFRELMNKVSIKDITLEECTNALYNRLNSDYRPMHGLCRFFLEYCGPGLEVGKYEFIPFMLNMPMLFESFVGEWLDEHLPREYRIKKQYHVSWDTEKRLLFKIDLILTDSKGKEVFAVLDTKYKYKMEPETRDIEQIIAYAVRMETQKGFLIYPSSDTMNIQANAGRVKVTSLVFDIGSDIENSGKNFLADLLGRIN
ncbi:MAG: restriction endonuclease [Candidatus Bathyarchaeota archaeon]